MEGEIHIRHGQDEGRAVNRDQNGDSFPKRRREVSFLQWTLELRDQTEKPFTGFSSRDSRYLICEYLLEGIELRMQEYTPEPVERGNWELRFPIIPVPKGYSFKNIEGNKGYTPWDPWKRWYEAR